MAKGLFRLSWEIARMGHLLAAWLALFWGGTNALSLCLLPVSEMSVYRESSMTVLTGQVLKPPPPNSLHWQLACSNRQPLNLHWVTNILKHH